MGVEGGGFFRWPTFYGNTNTSGSSSWGSQGSKGPSAPSFPYNHQARRLRGGGGGGLPALHRNHRHRATGKLCSIMARERERERGTVERREKGVRDTFLLLHSSMSRPIWPVLFRTTAFLRLIELTNLPVFIFNPTFVSANVP